jgi:DNA-binding transcriptional MerR regulator
MIKIGAFAKLSGLTVKTLRHYDELGLLKPAYVEKASGYRYYTADQLLTIRRIEGFKEQGLTLEGMRPLLTGAVSPTEAERTLLEKRKELESQIRKAQQQLEEIDQRLVRIERQRETEEGRFSLRSVEPALVASVRRVVPTGQLCLLLDELKQYVRAQGEDADRPVTIVRHKSADCGEEPADIEVAIPVSRVVPDSPGVRIYQLPGVMEAIAYTHRCDPYQNNSCKANDMLRLWAAQEGYQPLESVPVREVYLTPDKDLYGQLRMAEMILPIERV